MIKKIFVGAFHLSLYVLVFLGLVWFLLDINPKEAYVRSVENIQKSGERVSSLAGFMGQTGKDMRNSSNSQLSQANDRIHGKDPYEDTAKKFDELVLKR